MNFPKVLGYRVGREKLIEQCKRHEISSSGDYLTQAIRLIRRSGCPVDDFEIQKLEDIPKGEGDSFILTIYKCSNPKEEIDVKKVLEKFPPIFEEIKEDLGIVGDPQILYIEP